MPNRERGPDNKATESHGAEPATSADLSALALNIPEHLKETNPTTPEYTADSLKKKWEHRSIEDTGFKLTCRLVRPLS